MQVYINRKLRGTNCAELPAKFRPHPCSVPYAVSPSSVEINDGGKVTCCIQNHSNHGNKIQYFSVALTCVT